MWQESVHEPPLLEDRGDEFCAQGGGNTLADWKIMGQGRGNYTCWNEG